MIAYPTTAGIAARWDVGTEWTGRPRKWPSRTAPSGIWRPTNWRRTTARAVERTGRPRSRTRTRTAAPAPRTGLRSRLAAATTASAVDSGGTRSSARESRTCTRTVSRALSSWCSCRNSIYGKNTFDYNVARLRNIETLARIWVYEPFKKRACLSIK